MIDKAVAKAKRDALINALRARPSVLVAFSGGVDSALLLAAAREALGRRAVAATAVSPIHSQHEQDAAVRFTRERAIRHILIPTNEMTMPEFVANRADRCYHCKTALAHMLLQAAADKGMTCVAHGANMDDLTDYRPGLRAAREAGLAAPLMDAKLTKEEIRFLAREMGLGEWDKPAMACLASRFPYGCAITEKGLRRVEAAEACLAAQGFRGVRVRFHDTVARLEVDPSDMGRIMEDSVRQSVVAQFREIGFDHIALDMEGYLPGKMNRSING